MIRIGAGSLIRKDIDLEIKLLLLKYVSFLFLAGFTVILSETNFRCLSKIFFLYILRLVYKICIILVKI